MMKLVACKPRVFELTNILLLMTLLCLNLPRTLGQQTITLENDHIRLVWEVGEEGYRLVQIRLDPSSDPLDLSGVSGRYTCLFTSDNPDTSFNADLFNDTKAYLFDGYTPVAKRWRGGFRPVPLNTAGDACSFYPQKAEATADGVSFFYESDGYVVKANWFLDRLHRNDILVEMQLIAKEAGYYSLATPTLAETHEDDLEWAILPGYFQGRKVQLDLLSAYAYGQGIPHIPVVVRERTATTLAPMIQHCNGATVAVIPEPGIAADPWRADRHSRDEWRLGLSLMNRDAELSPTLYHPVLGEVDSYMAVGEERVFRFRYSVQQTDWFDVYKHAIYDVYEFGKAVQLKNTDESLSNRVASIIDYLKDDSTSLWRVHEYQGLDIGGQAYLGGVVGAQKDAMKNADYGAMWMLAKLTGDPVLTERRLPMARNFKLVQQQTEDGFFKGAAIGQYYLWKSHRFTEEWGDYVEPIALTYYTMLDLGNILLFEPDDDVLMERLRIGADRLLGWQLADGSWEVAYDRTTREPIFNDLTDFRPTFYGLLVAYRLLGDEKYLHGALKGADWFLEHAVQEGRFLGVCGDVRFVPDFATGQSAQALLDLYELTQQRRYLHAAIRVAKLYTTSVYTHPIPSQRHKEVKGKHREDWEITQVGLSFEHGGTVGSANGGGPIPLASHAGLFVRIADLTGDQLFLDMARAAAWGRDAFVDTATHVASYYWARMDSGPGPFPHHAWWQVGWITDYLMAEVRSRSGGRIHFPRGFITPKVGPHQPYGFAPGTIFDDSVALCFPKDLVKVDNQQIDLMSAKAIGENHAYIMLLNNSVKEQQTDLSFGNCSDSPTYKHLLIDEEGNTFESLTIGENGKMRITMPPLALRVIKLWTK